MHEELNSQRKQCGSALLLLDAKQATAWRMWQSSSYVFLVY